MATLADISLADSIAAFNSFGKTRTRHVREALKKFNISTPPRRTRHYTAWDNLPKDKTAILHVTNGKDRHWIIWFKNKFYDPAAGTFRKPPQYLIEQNSVPTSYLEIEFAQ